MIKFINHTYRVARSKVREVLKRTTRSSFWPSVRDKHLAVFNKCAACGETSHLQVHHIKPFHLSPQLELDPHNLITLCMGPNECHLFIGHGDDWKSYNPCVVKDSSIFMISPEKRERIKLWARGSRCKSSVD